MTFPKHKGVVVILGGTSYTIPPLSLGALEQLQERIGKFNGDVRDAATVVDAAYLAMKRNYPEITREELLDLIDVGNMAEVFEAVMDVSGLKRKAAEPGEQQEPEGN